MKTKIFPFNALEVNTYVVSDETGECVIIDPAFETIEEMQALISHIKENKYKVKHILLTHPHIDHILGAERLCAYFELPLEMHLSGVPILGKAEEHAAHLGLQLTGLPQAYTYIKHLDKIKFGNNELEARYAPGHCDGSVCYVSHSDKTVFTGDVLFHGSIGRSDLETGNYDLLKSSIYEQLFVLGDDFVVRPGHGGRTTIEHERYQNPFL